MTESGVTEGGSNDDALVAAWRVAARELAVSIVAPAMIEAHGELKTYVALVLDFGSPRGTAVVPWKPGEPRSVPLSSVPTDLRPYISFVSRSQYERFDRGLFIDTLNDWGWFGTSAPPEWYSGRPWTN